MEGYAGKDITLLFDVDVCVAGGGPSGTAAAINAARKGALLSSLNVAWLWEGWRYWDASILLWILRRRAVTRPM